jgi:hypothetical protein
MSWITPIVWTAKAIRYKVTRADMQTISDSLTALGDTDGKSLTAPGWVDSPNPWVYVDSTHFKIVGVDVTKRYTVGTPLSCTDATVTKYGYAGVATYVAGDTIVPFIGGSGYTLSGGAITNPRFSYMATPYGFPGTFVYTATTGGWSGTPSQMCHFTLAGHTCTVWIKGVNGTSTAGDTAVTVPFPHAAASEVLNAALVMDNGAAGAWGRGLLGASLDYIVFTKDAAGTAFTASGVKAIYDFFITYPI